jgi:hypothetical protein
LPSGEQALRARTPIEASGRGGMRRTRSSAHLLRFPTRPRAAILTNPSVSAGEDEILVNKNKEKQDVVRIPAWSRRMGAALLLLALGPTDYAAAQTWTPPVPGEDEWDWIQMTSSEWLKGDLKSLRDTVLEFDSDEFGLLTLDWSDIAFLRVASVYSFRIENVGVFTGTAIMQDGILRVRGFDGTVTEHPQNRVLVVATGGGREIDYWYAKATFGFVARSGNTDQADFNTNARIRRRSPKSRVLATYIGNMGKIGGETNINNHNATGSFDVNIRSGFFVTPLAVNYFRDPFQNIDTRITIAPGLGYEILNRGKMEWDVVLAGGYQNTRFGSVQPGEDSREENFSLIPGMTLSIDITSDIELDVDYNSQVGIPDPKRSFHHANAVLGIDVLGDLLSLDMAVTWDRTESPKRDAGGNTPNRDDFRMSFGIGVEL